MTKQKTIWIKDDVYANLKKIAAKENKSLTATAEEVILDFIQNKLQ